MTMGKRSAKSMYYRLHVCCLAFASCVSVAFGIDWSPTAAGTYEWGLPANWSGGAVLTATDTANFPFPSGDQTINIPSGSAVRYLDMRNYNTSSTKYYTRTFAGSLTTVSNDFRTGKTVLKGRIDVAGSGYGSVGKSSVFEYMGVLDIADGGIFCATNDYAICVARHPNGSDYAAAGRLVVHDGGQLFLGSTNAVSMNGLMMGRGNGAANPAVRVASYFQDGGYAMIRRMFAGFEKNAHAGITIADGVLELPWSENTRYRIGHLGYGIFQQLGGSVFALTNNITSTSTAWSTWSSGPQTIESFDIGSYKTTAEGRLRSSAYLCGGTFVCGDAIGIQGNYDPTTQTINRSAAPSADLTVDGNAEVTAKTVRVGCNMGAGAAVLNLNGGMLSTIYIRDSRPDDNNTRPGANEVNGNGGTLRTYHPTNPDYDSDIQFKGINRIMVYPKGLTLQGDVSTRIGAADRRVPLRSAKGYGVESITINSTATDWYTPPCVDIYGGSGSNATAVALIDYSRNTMTGIVVTCRGEGYAPDDKLTVALYKNDANATVFSSAVVTLTPNTPGTFVKTGANRVVLWEQPDFDGTYEVRQGRLLQAAGGACGSTNLAALVVGGTSDATFQCGSGNSTATAENWNLVNTNATLTLGTEYGPGRFELVGAHSGSVPFEQSFKSLAVNGTGNVIECAYNPTGAGFKLSFGTLTCADGAKVTIPHWNDTSKVYVTGMSQGSRLPGVVFNGTDRHAIVGEGGLLVPNPLGFFLILR
ncbi:MAG: hypothetical protein IKU71_10420 [Kiritimatiellae bacterium]|nr:hypothetical protein [Kiritimatiellia bacterium]